MSEQDEDEVTRELTEALRRRVSTAAYPSAAAIAGHALQVDERRRSPGLRFLAVGAGTAALALVLVLAFGASLGDAPVPSPSNVAVASPGRATPSSASTRFTSSPSPPAPASLPTAPTPSVTAKPTHAEHPSPSLVRPPVRVTLVDVDESSQASIRYAAQMRILELTGEPCFGGVHGDLGTSPAWEEMARGFTGSEAWLDAGKRSWIGTRAGAAAALGATEVFVPRQKRFRTEAFLTMASAVPDRVGSLGREIDPTALIAFESRRIELRDGRTIWWVMGDAVWSRDC